MIPGHDGFMDDEFRRFWQSLFDPLDERFRLYGGTALALYLNHRKTNGLNFVTAHASIDMRFAQGLPLFNGAELDGGPGIVDAIIKRRLGNVRVSIMEFGPLIPHPTRPPISAQNGVLVAHPVDLIIAKCIACVSRGASRDYFDLASAFEALPRMGHEAVKAVPGQPVARLAACLADLPTDAMKMLGKERVIALRRFACSITPAYGLDDEPDLVP